MTKRNRTRLLHGLVFVVIVFLTSTIRDSSLIGASTVVGRIAASGRPPMLVQAGDSKSVCIYAGIGSLLRRAEAATGISYRCVETFSNADPTWSDWVDPWVIHPQYGYTKWLAADPTKRTIVLTQDLIPDSEAANPNWRAQGAAGRFDPYARQLAENLVKAGFGYSVIRLGHEMNGTWYRDSIGNTPIEWHEWARYFAQIVRTMRSVRGANFLFDWNVNAGYRDIPLADYYPGNRYVDIIGIDLYDAGASYTLPSINSPVRWRALASEPLGLNAVEAFATAHHKPLSIPEWATLKSAGNGDDGAYVTQVGAFVASHDVAYQSWFDSGSDNALQLSARSAPRSVAAYAEAFAPRH